MCTTLQCKHNKALNTRFVSTSCTDDVVLSLCYPEQGCLICGFPRAHWSCL